MKRITISLEDDLYRVAKAYAISEDISLSKAVGRLLRRAVEAPRVPHATGRIGEEVGPYRYRDSRTGLLVTTTRMPIPVDAAQRLEEEEDLAKWNCGQGP